jgi:S-adenosylmethionine-diacylglycerol 3-amino-3-carboxypropyl transferase
MIVAEQTTGVRVAPGVIRYSAVWEDADVLCKALGPVAKGGRLLSIASAGDNTLALLTLDPAEVVAVDTNPAQLACLELRMAAFRRLEDADLIAFLGVTPSACRRATYQKLRGDLSSGARDCWDARPDDLARGIIHIGRFERYLRAFRRFLLPLIHPRWKIEQLRKPRSLAEQEEFYDRRWNTGRWRCLFRLFFNRAVMGRLGRDPSFFTHVRGPVVPPFLARTRHALTALPTHSNPYLAYIITGSYPLEARPRYLRPEHAPTIRALLERVRLVEGCIDTAANGRFDGFNLSDIFEYMSESEHERCYAALADRANHGARLAYWNMMVPRGCPSSQRDRIRPLEALAAELHARDRAWFYQCFHLDEMVAGVA